MAGIKIDPEMLDIYMESLNKLMAGSETDGGNWYNIMRKSTSWEMI